MNANQLYGSVETHVIFLRSCTERRDDDALQQGFFWVPIAGLPVIVCSRFCGDFDEREGSSVASLTEQLHSRSRIKNVTRRGELGEELMGIEGIVTRQLPVASKMVETKVQLFFLLGIMLCSGALVAYCYPRPKSIQGRDCECKDIVLSWFSIGVTTAKCSRLSLPRPFSREPLPMLCIRDDGVPNSTMMPGPYLRRRLVKRCTVLFRCAQVSIIVLLVSTVARPWDTSALEYPSPT